MASTFPSPLISRALFACLPFVLLSGCSKPEEPVKTMDEYSMEEKQQMAMPFHQEASESVEPFMVIGNIYSVGAKNIGVYLITTGEGHILIDSGVSEMASVVTNNIKTLGFAVEDVNILLSTHAHFDHVQAHEALRQATGAEVMAMEGDAEALTQGKDLSPLGFEGWEPVKVSKVLKHRDTVSLGDTTLTAHQIPGHTPGCTVWELDVTEAEKTFNVAIFGCRGPNDGVKLVGNEDFPQLNGESMMGFQRLTELAPDLYLSNHPEKDIQQWGDAMKAGERPHPMLNQQPWADMVQALTVRFFARVEEAELRALE